VGYSSDPSRPGVGAALVPLSLLPHPSCQRFAATPRKQRLRPRLRTKIKGSLRV